MDPFSTSSTYHRVKHALHTQRRTDKCLTDERIGQNAPALSEKKKSTTTGGRTWVTAAIDPGGGDRISLHQTPLRNKGKSNLKLEKSFQTSPGEAENGTEPALVD